LIGSTDLVTNLNADLLDGKHASEVGFTDPYYVLTKAYAQLVNSRIHPNTGSPNYNVKHEFTDITGVITDAQHGTKKTIPNAHHFEDHGTRHNQSLDFGYKTKDTASVSIWDTIWGTSYLCPANSEALSITVYLKTSGAKVKCAIYESNTVFTFIAATEEKTLGSTDDWVTFNFPSPPVLEAGKYYLLCVWANDTCSIYGLSGTTVPGTTLSLTYDSFPATLSKYTTTQWSIYCTLEADPLSVGVPVDIGTTNVEGTALNYARRDHVHNHPSGLGADLHHATHLKTLADHPLSIIPTMDDAHIPDVETLSYGGPFAVAQIPSLPRSKISDFFASPFWANIPDKPSAFPPSAHASTHHSGGADPLALASIAGVITDVQHGTKTSIPDAHHARSHDHSLAADGSPIAVAGVPDLPATKITSLRFPMARMPDGTLNRALLAQGAGVDPVYGSVHQYDYNEGTTDISTTSATWVTMMASFGVSVVQNRRFELIFGCGLNVATANSPGAVVVLRSSVSGGTPNAMICGGAVHCGLTGWNYNLSLLASALAPFTGTMNIRVDWCSPSGVTLYNDGTQAAYRRRWRVLQILDI